MNIFVQKGFHISSLKAAGFFLGGEGGVVVTDAAAATG